MVDRGKVVPWAWAELAEIHALQGRKEEAYGFLEKRIEAGSVYHREYGRDPCFAALRDEQRFQQLMARAEARVAEMRRTVELREAS